MSVYNNLYGLANTIKIIDTHEHLNPNSNLRIHDINDILHAMLRGNAERTFKL